MNKIILQGLKKTLNGILAKERIEFFYKLSNYKKVDSAGKWNNNIEGGPLQVDKKEFIKDYKFVISFENSSYPGYITEKVIEPIMVNSIPIYWGNPLVEKDINENRIINVGKFNSMDLAIEKIIEIDRDDLMALDIINQPAFNEDKIPYQINKEELLNFFMEAIDSKKIPFAKTLFGRIYDFRIISLINIRKLKNRIKNTLISMNKNFITSLFNRTLKLFIYLLNFYTIYTSLIKNQN